MKLSYEWLKDFVEIRFSPEKLADKLTMSGLEVEELERVGQDTHYELGVTPNRSDCLSVIGVARDVAAITGKKLANTKVTAPKGRGKIAKKLKVKVKHPARCPRYTARRIEGVKIGSSPAWMVKRLAAAGVRSINNVVDATNYVMIERGQPLHAFDARMIHENKIVVRMAEGDKHFGTLDGEKRRLDPEDLLICDGTKSVALGGVMGGENSEVSESTTDLVLESAYFEPSGIRRTSKRLGLVTESSRRFEKGVDPNGVLDALHRLTEVIVEVAGGTPTEDWIDVYPKKIQPKRVTLDTAEVKRVVGIAVPVPQIRKIMTALGFHVSGVAPKLKISVPTHRPDVTRPVDIIEELVRVYGYHRIPESLPYASSERFKLPREYEHIETTRDALVNIGFTEALLTAFEHGDSALAFSDDSALTPAEISNPLSQEASIMRTTLVTGLLDAAKVNINRQRKDLKLFALQRVYRRPVGTVRADEPLRLAGLLMGRRNQLSWKASGESVGFYDAKGAVEAVLSRLKLYEQILFQRGGHYEHLVPGSYATVLCANKRMGWVGRLHPSLLARWDIDEPIFAFEIDFESVSKFSRQLSLRFREVSRFPFVERDLSILVDENIPHVEVEQTISKSLNTLLTDVRLFDVYHGKGIPGGKKSLSYAIRYASEDRTLTDDEVNQAHAKVLEAVTSKLGATVR
jgi:phenylalanyl-tRNA synthetase beta chain